MFTAAIAVTLVMVATIAVTVVAVILAAHRARNAADLAALAAATAETSGLDPCLTARVNAHQNGARVSACQVSGRTDSFVVTVTVAVDSGLGRPLPVDVKAVAYAGNVHDE